MKKCKMLGHWFVEVENKGGVVRCQNGPVKINLPLVGTNKLCKVLLTGTGDHRIAIQLVRKLEISRYHPLSVIPKHIIS